MLHGNCKWADYYFFVIFDEGSNLPHYLYISSFGKGGVCKGYCALLSVLLRRKSGINVDGGVRKRMINPECFFCRWRAESGTRTPDLLITNELLYQLS